MVDKVVNLYHQYYEQFVVWYNGLEPAAQYGFIIVVGIAVFLIVVLFALVKLTR